MTPRMTSPQRGQSCEQHACARRRRHSRAKRGTAIRFEPAMHQATWRARRARAGPRPTPALPRRRPHARCAGTGTRCRRPSTAGRRGRALPERTSPAARSARMGDELLRVRRQDGDVRVRSAVHALAPAAGRLGCEQRKARVCRPSPRRRRRRWRTASTHWDRAKAPVARAISRGRNGALVECSRGVAAAASPTPGWRPNWYPIRYLECANPRWLSGAWELRGWDSNPQPSG
jgi:hypothetical protein